VITSPSSKARSAFLLGMTITELALLLFFILLLTLIYKIDRYTQSSEQLRNNIRLLVQSKKVRDYLLKEVYSQDARKVIQTLIPSEACKKSMARLIVTNERLESRNEGLAKDIVKLNEKLKVAGMSESAQSDALAASLAQCKQSQKSIRQFPQRVWIEYDKDKRLFENLAKHIAEINKNLEKEKSNYKSCTKELYECRGFPACWEDGNKKIQYLLRLKIYSDSIQLWRNWPQDRQGEVNQFALLKNIKNSKKLTINEFRALAQPIFEKSKVNECRHYVRITEDQNISMKDFKRNLLVIESYFYKYFDKQAESKNIKK